jgi:very-short-patch-repair endonuclease
MNFPSDCYAKISKAREELLDLGNRNPLINYKLLKARGLEVINAKPEIVYEQLVKNGKALTFEIEPNDLFRSTYPPKSIKDTKLIVKCDEKELEKRLFNTYSAAKTYLEDHGVNTLFMAIGMLHWKEVDYNKKDQVSKSPLILIPVKLERASVKDKFKLTYNEDEISHNNSLNKKLLQEFNIDMPEIYDNEDLNVKSFMDEVEEAIDGTKDWFIDRNSIVIGMFSFSKLMMYEDLDPEYVTKDFELESNPTARALLCDTGFRSNRPKIHDEEHIDEYYDLSETKFVVDADSSQIHAILESLSGKSMVIQGPPGTGKSQTITNLIAEAISRQKKVLFVSEKMAALEVVKHRLDHIGLGSMCLELHSNKMNKKHLLLELSKTNNMEKSQHKAKSHLNLHNEYREKLNKYAFAMNEVVKETDVTPQISIGQILKLNEKCKGIKFPGFTIKNMLDWTSEQFSSKENYVKQIQDHLHRIGKPSNHLFWGITKKSLSPLVLETISLKVADLCAGFREFLDKKNSFIELLGHENINDIKSLRRLFLNLRRVENAPNLRDVMIKNDSWKNNRDLSQILNVGSNYTILYNKYKDRLIPGALKNDMRQLRNTLDKYKFNLIKYFYNEYRLAKREFLAMLRDPSDYYESMLNIVDDVIKLQLDLEIIHTNDDKYKNIFGSSWKSENSDWQDLEKVSSWLHQLYNEIEEGKLSEWILEYLEKNIDHPKIISIIVELEKDIKGIQEKFNELIAYMEFDEPVISKNSKLNMDLSLSNFIFEIENWGNNIHKLKEIVDFNMFVNECNINELQPISEIAVSWDYASSHLVDALRYKWFTCIFDYAYRTRPEIAEFNSEKHNTIIEKFRELDKKYNNENIERVKSAYWHFISKSKENEDGQSHWNELIRELNKKSRNTPIRKLLEKAKFAIQSIKPVFMMSPLSVATYLKPGAVKFDLVIFDEASQLKPVDAFGAIFRGKQVIVVGDDKQMPPTSFFETINDEDDEDMEEDEQSTRDYESILGMFVSKNAYSAMLRWHYRSKHPSLIQVSNEEFYNNKLFLFPNANHQNENLGLKLHYLPDTYYDRSKSRINKLEAQAIAQAVMNHFRQNSNQSLGVVAFSKSQKEAIEDELELLRRNDPSLEDYFSTQRRESFFVKNLENVQGDERDVIMISVGYGKTREGLLNMNFGPVNQQGGERRLNVLISRAKYRCEVFTNFRYVDMDLDKIKSYGVKVLYQFLKFAETGVSEYTLSKGDFESPFEEHVYDELTARGYDVDTQIGSGGFRIDLAVRDPERPGKYILGIECDGATYHRARSARDRDRIRQYTLEQQGWKIHRIWSTEWFNHPTQELDRLIAAIEKVKEEERAKYPVTQKTKIKVWLKTNRFRPSETSIYTETQDQSMDQYKVAPISIGEAEAGSRKFSFIMRVPSVSTCVKCNAKLDKERVNLAVYAAKNFNGKSAGYFQTDLYTCVNCKYICADQSMVDHMMNGIKGYYINVQDIEDKPQPEVKIIDSLFEYKFDDDYESDFKQKKYDDETELFKTGYKITGLTRNQRWNILQNNSIPQIGLHNVISTIEYLIRIKSSTPKMKEKYKYALQEWKYDLDRLRKYYYGN